MATFPIDSMVYLKSKHLIVIDNIYVMLEFYFFCMVLGNNNPEEMKSCESC